MKNPLRTVEDYELFLYTLREKFPSIRHSTITLIRKGASLARVTGELSFDKEIRLVVRERIVYDRLPAIIDWYGYEVWQGNEKLHWYDSQPHPNEANLQSTYPHHKHIQPDIKNHRIPAQTTFISSNMEMLIREIETLIKENKGAHLK